MPTIDEIGKAVAKLPREELAASRTWFEAFDPQRFDTAIEQDARSGTTSSRPRRHGDDEMGPAGAARTREARP